MEIEFWKTSQKSLEIFHALVRRLCRHFQHNRSHKMKFQVKYNIYARNASIKKWICTSCTEISEILHQKACDVKLLQPLNCKFLLTLWPSDLAFWNSFDPWKSNLGSSMHGDVTKKIQRLKKNKTTNLCLPVFVESLLTLWVYQLQYEPQWRGSICSLLQTD